MSKKLFAQMFSSVLYRALYMTHGRKTDIVANRYLISQLINLWPPCNNLSSFFNCGHNPENEVIN